MRHCENIQNCEQKATFVLVRWVSFFSITAKKSFFLFFFCEKKFLLFFFRKKNFFLFFLEIFFFFLFFQKKYFFFLFFFCSLSRAIETCRSVCECALHTSAW